MKTYFELSELCVTSTGEFNFPPIFGVSRGNLEQLMSVLNILRHLLGKPIYVNSGFRTEKVNKAVGGVPNSLHLQGRAADIRANDMDALNNLCSLFYSKGIFVEYIDKGSFIHIAI